MEKGCWVFPLVGLLLPLLALAALAAHGGAARAALERRTPAGAVAANPAPGTARTWNAR